MSTVRAPQRIPSRGIPSRKPESPAEKRRHLRVVTPQRRRVRPSVLVASVLTAVFLILLALAAFHTVLVANQQKLDTLDQKVAAQQDEFEKLRLEATRLESPDRIVAEATERLGMVPPEATTYLTPSGAAWAEITGGDPADVSRGEDASPPARNDDWSEVKRSLSDQP